MFVQFAIRSIYARRDQNYIQEIEFFSSFDRKMLSLSVVVLVDIIVLLCVSKAQCVCIQSDNSTQKLNKQGGNTFYNLLRDFIFILFVVFSQFIKQLIYGEKYSCPPNYCVINYYKKSNILGNKISCKIISKQFALVCHPLLSPTILYSVPVC